MLAELKKEKIFTYFEALSNIPRGSYHNEKISEYLVQFAMDKGLSFFVDSKKNVIIKKPATNGCKNQSPVILQGHMDMVCETEGTAHDFTTEPLDLYIDGDFIKARGTTLGADNGIALAYALTILEDDNIEHPPLEVLFTTDEEVGMLGAMALDLSQLTGKMLINLDSEEEGVLLAACAGGMTVECSFPIVNRHVCQEKGSRELLQIVVSGLQGGHSGLDINKNRTNAAVLLGRILIPFLDHCELVEIQGGKTDNVITREASAVIWFDGDKKVWESFCRKKDEVIREICTAEPDTTISCTPYSGEAVTLGIDMTKCIVMFMNTAPQGVQVMSTEMEGIVESSLNMGAMQTEEDKVSFGFSIRSQKSGYKEYLYQKIGLLAETFGGVCEKKRAYPEWDYKKDSALREVMKKVYRKQYGEEMLISGVHAGLECGIFYQGIPEVDIVSIGPDMFDVHSPKEKLSIASARRVFLFLVQVLKEIAAGSEEKDPK